MTWRIDGDRRLPLRSLARSISCGTRSLVVLAQAEQSLSELGLSGTLRTTADSLAAEIDQLGYPLPAGAAGGCVLSVLDKLLGLLSRLSDGLVLFVVVVFIKVIDGLLSSLDSLGLAVGGHLVAMRDGQVTTLAPFADDIGLLLLFKGGLIGGVEG